ncbi:redoxin domain-containing protein [Candidatus Bipolaricaulota sp. J31]
MRRLFPMWGIIVLLLAFPLLAEGLKVSLAPASAPQLGEWASGKLAFRLYPSLERPLKREGPEPAMSLFGILTLGGVEYPLMFAVLPDDTPYLAVDFDRDGVLTATEGSRGTPLTESEWFWHLRFTVHDRPYELSVIWPEGRGFLFLVGQTPMKGEFELDGIERTMVLIDANVNGNYNDDVDLYVVDVDGDGVLHGEPGGHELFALTEPFTVGDRSFKLAEVAPDGSSVALVPTAYVPPKVPLYIGAPAPEFSFVDLKGREVSLKELRGKVVLLDFWASWCLPCVAATPKMKAIYQDYHGRGLEIVGINLDISREQAEAFIDHFELPWPQYWDGKGYDGELVRLFRVEAIPTLYLIDREGRIRGKWLGLAEEELRQAIEGLLGPEATSDGPPPEGMAGPAEGEDTAASPGPILSLEVPPWVELRPANPTIFVVGVKNTSPYEAEDLSIGLADPPPGVRSETITVASLPPGEEISVRVPLIPSGTPAAGRYPTAVEVKYRFCVDEGACFKFAQRAAVLLVMGTSAMVESPSGDHEPGAGTASAWWLVAIGALVVLAVALILGQ